MADYGTIKVNKVTYKNGSDADTDFNFKTDIVGTSTDNTFTANITIDNQKELRLGEPDGAGSNYVGFEAPDTIASNVVWKLPNADGSANYLLKTDGSGNLGWAADSATDSTKLPLAGGTLTGNVALNDDVEFQFGAGSGGDLKIYHNGTSHDSFIEERGTGNLKIAASQIQFLNAAKDETTAIFTEDAGAALYYNNASKLTTASGGVDVTGNVDLTGSIVFEGATADAHETTLAVTDPTADRTITLPNATGTAALLQEDQAWAGSQRGTLNAIGTTGTFTIPLDSGNNHSITLSGGSTLTFSDLDADAIGQSGTVYCTNNGAHSHGFAGHCKFVKGLTIPAVANKDFIVTYFVPTASTVVVDIINLDDT